MTWDWGRLATAIKRRRKELGLTQKQLADQAGVTDTTVRNLEGGRTFSRIPPSIRPLEMVLGWEVGSIRAILEGGEPTLATGSSAEPKGQPAAALTGLAERLPTSFVHELERGEVFAADVQDLTLDGGLRLFTVVIRNPDQEPRSADRVKAETEAWYRIQRDLRRQQPVDTADHEGESGLE